MKRIAQRPLSPLMIFLGAALVCAFMAQTSTAGRDPQSRPQAQTSALLSASDLDSPPNDHCTDILVGKGASADGSVMNSRTPIIA